jgi:hypothetical protein
MTHKRSINPLKDSYMNENQKKTSEQYRTNYDEIFRPKRRDNDDGLGVQGVHSGLGTEEPDAKGAEGAE